MSLWLFRRVRSVSYLHLARLAQSGLGAAQCRTHPGRGEKLNESHDPRSEIAAPWDRLSRLSRAGLRINEHLDLDAAPQGVVDEARLLTGAIGLAAHSCRPGAVRTVAGNIRRKLGDDGNDPTYIFNEPRVGYRMPKGKPGSRTRSRSKPPLTPRGALSYDGVGSGRSSAVQHEGQGKSS